MVDSNDMSKTICELADAAVSLERIRDYGHPRDNFEDIAAMWTTYLGDRLVSCLTASDIPMLMILAKVCRNITTHKRDNLVDIAGFAKTADMVHQSRKSENVTNIHSDSSV